MGNVAQTLSNVNNIQNPIKLPSEDEEEDEIKQRPSIKTNTLVNNTASFLRRKFRQLPSKMSVVLEEEDESKNIKNNPQISNKFESDSESKI